MVTFGVLPFLDGEQTVFGKIHTDSQSIADQVEGFSGSTYEGTPSAEVKISNWIVA